MSEKEINTYVGGIVVVNNKDRMHFESKLPNGEFAFIEYRWYKKDLALMHTLVPKEFEGKGIASAIVKFALDYAKENNLKVIVYCPYVASWLKRHPEYEFLVNKDYRS